MKYLETYLEVENSLLKYKKGDYVLLDLETILTKYGTNWQGYPTNKFARIYKVKSTMHIQPYLILVDHDHPFNIFHLKEDEILRKMTPKEIKQYKLEQIANKYNL